MAVVTLRQPLRRLAGGAAEHAVQGACVRELLGELERLQPWLRGWILDERGNVRRHINVFVNGEYGSEDTAVGAHDRIDVLPAISGG
jgi:molybdopterin synthase sulfur carrier subunit